MDFGPVGTDTSAVRKFSMENMGKTAVSGDVDANALHNTPFGVTRGSGPFRLTHNQVRNVAVKFAPTSAGLFNGTITITISLNGNALGVPILPVNLSGMGEPGALEVVTGTTLDFGNVKVHSKKNLTLAIKDTGLGVLHGNIDTKSTLGKPFSARGAGRYTLPGTKSRSVTVTFAPTSTGSFTGTIKITSDDPANPTFPVTVKGTGGTASRPVH